VPPGPEIPVPWRLESPLSRGLAGDSWHRRPRHPERGRDESLSPPVPDGHGGSGRRAIRRVRARALAGSARSGYILAKMRFEVILAPEAVEDLRSLKANLRAAVREALEAHLRHEPGKASKSRIKRLRGLSRPQYRLRVGEVRVFYDVAGDTVEVLAIVSKSEAQSWLARFANPE